MSTDDRDIESSNPSKNFKVGEFDQGSGFFTPVWESKRRIRSEPPAAPPSSKGGSQRAAPSSRAPAQERSQGGSEPPPAPPAADTGQASEGESGKTKGAPVPRPRASTAGKSRARSNPPARAATPVPPAPPSERPAAPPEDPASAPLAALPPELAAVFNAPGDDDSRAPAAAAAPSEVEPDAQREPRLQASPGAAARALREAGPDLPPAAFLDEEPDFRSPRRDVALPEVPRPGRTERSPLHYRALRATSAATRVHEQLKAKLQAEAAEIDESRYDLEPETHPNPLHEPAEPDPYPLSLMRRLRRTIRLSTPVPDRIRSVISKYDRG